MLCTVSWIVCYIISSGSELGKFFNVSIFKASLKVSVITCFTNENCDLEKLLV